MDRQRDTPLHRKHADSGSRVDGQNRKNKKGGKASWNPDKFSKKNFFLYFLFFILQEDELKIMWPDVAGVSRELAARLVQITIYL